jgi:hypothetical protein
MTAMSRRWLTMAAILVVVAVAMLGFSWAGNRWMQAPMPQGATFVAPGIELPAGIATANLPRGLTDYVRHKTLSTPATFVAPGIELPRGMSTANLPRGLTDYVRHKALGTSATFVAPGIEPPTGMITTNLPRGLTDYIRH